jgi:hypothetical protein
MSGRSLTVAQRDVHRFERDQNAGGRRQRDLYTTFENRQRGPHAARRMEDVLQYSRRGKETCGSG